MTVRNLVRTGQARVVVDYPLLPAIGSFGGSAEALAEYWAAAERSCEDTNTSFRVDLVNRRHADLVQVEPVPAPKQLVHSQVSIDVALTSDSMYDLGEALRTLFGKIGLPLAQVIDSRHSSSTPMGRVALNTVLSGYGKGLEQLGSLEKALETSMHPGYSSVVARYPKYASVAAL